VCGNLKKILANPKMTYPIKKRINTELFILMGNMSFLYTRDRSRPLRERYKQLSQTPEHVVMKTNDTSLFKMSNKGDMNENLLWQPA